MCSDVYKRQAVKEYVLNAVKEAKKDGLSMLRILDNPLQDIPMAAVLASPIVGMDDEELAQIRSCLLYTSRCV